MEDDAWRKDSDKAPPPDGEVADEEGEEDFAALLEASLKPVRQLRRGERVTGRVVGSNDEWIFLDLGTKGEGLLAASELESGPNPRAVSPGDHIEAYALSEEEGEVRLTTRIVGPEASRSLLEEAYRSEIPVEGNVVKEVKGGFEVQVGSSRCFCPYSQMDFVRRGAAHYLGQNLTFAIAEFREGGRNIVLSRRQLLEAERLRRLAELRSTLEPGAAITGQVRSLEAFGAFVDLGGVDGLIPLAEISWGRVAHASEVVTAGEMVETQVVDVDWDRQRITLSLKRLTPNPWTHVQERFKDGDVTTGRVVSLANYGAFVEIEPGIEGMIHVSRFGTAKRVQHPREVVSVGAVVQVRIEHMDVDNRRLGLSLVSEAESVACPRREEPSAAPVAVGETHAAVVEKVKPFGVLARLPDGRTGLIPVSELLTPHKAVLRRHYAPGQQLAVQVVEVSEGGKRVRLSERAAREAGDASLANDYFKAQSPTKSSGFGSLGDLLKKPRR